MGWGVFKLVCPAGHHPYGSSSSLDGFMSAFRPQANQLELLTQTSTACFAVLAYRQSFQTPRPCYHGNRMSCTCRSPK